MFTVGIFSTHIPYIAFVFFYAFFFVIGIPKASAGELSHEDEKMITGIQFDAGFPISEKKIQSIHFDFHFTLEKSTDFEFSPGLESRYPLLHLEQISQRLLCFARFARPPPLA